MILIFFFTKGNCYCYYYYGYPNPTFVYFVLKLNPTPEKKKPLKNSRYFHKKKVHNTQPTHNHYRKSKAT